MKRRAAGVVSAAVLAGACIGPLGAMVDRAVGAAVLTGVASFDGTNGSGVKSAVAFDSAGNLYGTAFWGGNGYINPRTGNGTVFELAAHSNTITTVVAFDATGSNGAAPDALVVDHNGNVFGTTYAGQQGGTTFNGTVFEIAAGSNTLTTLASFDGTKNARRPEGRLVLDASGNLLGATEFGGTNNSGAFYKYTASNHVITRLASFNPVNQEMMAGGVAVDRDGNLYTADGGFPGEIFELPADASNVVVRGAFDVTNGSQPLAGPIVNAVGNLFGMTVGGGANSLGSVYEIPAGTNTIVTLASFTGTNGSAPEGTLLMDAAGNLFGATGSGGANGNGTIFQISGVTHTLTTLASFTSATTGAHPIDLTADANGNLWGATLGGGPTSTGVIFELTGSGYVVPEPGALSLLAIVAVVCTGLRARRLKSSQV